MCSRINLNRFFRESIVMFLHFGWVLMCAERCCGFQVFCIAIQERGAKDKCKIEYTKKS